jgi:hypothetical protein
LMNSSPMNTMIIAFGAGFAAVGVILLGVSFRRPRIHPATDLPKSAATELISSVRNDSL